jgi:hypothetical protein
MTHENEKKKKIQVNLVLVCDLWLRLSFDSW